jgi:sugar transferase (PEP-CTERM/EpsH1 system associated)
MRIVMVTHEVPRPTWGAGIRNYHLLRQLARHHSVRLLSVVDDLDAAASQADELRDLVAGVALVPLPGRARKRIQQFKFAVTGRSYLLTEFSPPEAEMALAAMHAREPVDVVLFESVLPAGIAVPPGARVIVDQHNIEHEMLRRVFEAERQPVRKIYNWIEFRWLRPGELERCARATAVTVTSERERRLLGELIPSAAPIVVPNGVDLGAFSPARSADEISGRIVFTGTLGYYPNVQAVQHFAQAIWPAVRAKEPEATWQIVGSHPPVEVRRLGELPGIMVTGTVPQVQPYLAAAAVVVVPILVGAGTRLKVLEALAMGKAVVTTSVGCEGLGLVSGEHAIIADDPATFATAVSALLRDDERREALGRAGRALAEERYGWERCAAPLLDLLEQFSVQPAPAGERTIGGSSRQ